jgi:hypothetical protein
MGKERVSKSYSYILVKVTNYGTAEADSFVNHKPYLLKAPNINSDILTRYVELREVK